MVPCPWLVLPVKSLPECKSFLHNQLQYSKCLLAIKTVSPHPSCQKNPPFHTEMQNHSNNMHTHRLTKHHWLLLIVFNCGNKFALTSDFVHHVCIVLLNTPVNNLNMQIIKFKPWWAHFDNLHILFNLYVASICLGINFSLHTRYHTRKIWYQLKSMQGLRVDIKFLQGDSGYSTFGIEDQQTCLTSRWKYLGWYFSSFVSIPLQQVVKLKRW